MKSSGIQRTSLAHGPCDRCDIKNSGGILVGGQRKPLSSKFFHAGGWPGLHKLDLRAPGGLHWTYHCCRNMRLGFCNFASLMALAVSSLRRKTKKTLITFAERWVGSLFAAVTISEQF